MNSDGRNKIGTAREFLFNGHRKETNRLFDMINEGLVSAEQVVLMCVTYMSEDEVADMMHCNELNEEED